MVSGNLVKNYIKTIFGSSQYGYSVGAFGLGTRGVCGRTGAAWLRQVQALDAGHRRCVGTWVAIRVRDVGTTWARRRVLREACAGAWPCLACVRTTFFFLNLNLNKF